LCFLGYKCLKKHTQLPSFMPVEDFVAHENSWLSEITYPRWDDLTDPIPDQETTMSDYLVAVTGGGSGIGAAISEIMALRGATVGILEIDEVAAAETTERIASRGGNVFYIVTDVANEESVKQSFNQIRSEHGLVEVVVNNAGKVALRPLPDVTAESLAEIFAVNVNGYYFVTGQGFKQMDESGRGGTFINACSIGGIWGLPLRAEYEGTKGAVQALTRATAREGISYGISANGYDPCRVHTGLMVGYLKKHFAGEEQETFEALCRAQPWGTVAKPSQVGYLSAFLADRRVRGVITGQTIPIDYGVTSIDTPFPRVDKRGQ
jgi:2-keto-3-deoxy-L-fuconate dehydrogenase